MVRKMIVFQLKEEEYAVSVQEIGSIERMVPITRVPQTPEHVKGVINLRGVVTPIIDLGLKFGFQEAEITDATRILIVYINGMEVGLIVDSANDVMDIPEDMIEPNPEVIGSIDVNYIEGVAKIDNRLFILLDLHKVLQLEALEEIVEGK
ncbi:chemotaxis protein CheW [Oceanobacillus sp. Castelsardo]|uniref:chemotaxis protein CheW n=1 Tax=Oceanobacillus sp. Castelsardo TaxID=1851204 RepID=UPI00083811BB|nr:chemotaxis protein CheW [Oceanobacillus sp. Castelsardo]